MMVGELNLIFESMLSIICHRVSVATPVRINNIIKHVKQNDSLMPC